MQNLLSADLQFKKRFLGHDKGTSLFHFVPRKGGPLNGNLHWVMNSNELRSWVIVHFDFSKEKFVELPRPSFGDERIETYLVVLRGYLYSCRFGDQKQVEIWAMKEYGKKDSWTNLVVIPNMIETSILFNFKPLFIMENSEIVLEVESREIVICNPNDGKYRSLKRYDIGCRAIPYVESLILLNGEGEIGRQHEAYPQKSKRKKRYNAAVAIRGKQLQQLELGSYKWSGLGRGGTLNSDGNNHIRSSRLA
ncbi:F-box protein At3g07870-like [Actinidia eriantha]|uniref:F-box protein At3g07870-like n=1 Tax=Actinidia eriantha TaxID=165200 RepID=UPI002589387D|nr:F-box protein At3g07870-like [Actinidia eriantha]